MTPHDDPGPPAGRRRIRMRPAATARALRAARTAPVGPRRRAAAAASLRPWPGGPRASSRRRWPWPGGPRASAVALACSVGFGVVVGALAGPPASPSAQRTVVVAAPTASAEPASSGDLSALQAPPPAPAPPPPPAVAAAPTDDASSIGGDAGDDELVATAEDDAAADADGTETAADGDDGAAAARRAGKTSTAPAPRPPRLRHVALVVLADKSFPEAFGPTSAAPFLARELRAQGALMRRYYATAHGSLPNLLTLLTGQASNPLLAGGCPELTAFSARGSIRTDGQLRGSGCVLPASLPSLPAQLERDGRGWRAYLGSEDPAAPSPCAPPPPAPDGTPAVVDRNPFLFLAGVRDAAECPSRVTTLAPLAADLAAPAKDAPALTLILPDPCNAGREGACPPGEPDGLARSDAWLRTWIPRLLAAPAYADDGAVVVTFDQARVSGPLADSESCCHQPRGVNEPASVDPQAPVAGGGRVGALVLSPRARPGVVTNRAYNHLALLRTIEDALGLDHLALAGADGLPALGDDVFRR